MNRTELIDIGANLTHKRFDSDREQVIARAVEAGVGTLVVTGADAGSSRAAQNLETAQAAALYATAGVHPHHASDWSPATATEIAALASSPRVVAVGETGLDFNRDFSPRGEQQSAFEAQLQLAAERGLPAFLHQRDAHERFLAIIREYREHLGGGAVVHCFTGGREELWPFLDLDLHIGVTGWLCDERRGEALRACLRDIPLDRLMLETDAPYLTPRDLRPRPVHGRNEPAFLPHVLAAAAELRREPPETLAAGTTATARAFFDL